MDWKTFIASLVASLAWPAVFVGAIVVLRGQLQSLLTRDAQLASVRQDRSKFEENLGEAHRHAELLNGDAEALPPARPLEPASSPIATVLLAHNELYEMILRAKKTALLPADTPLQQVLSVLVQRGLLRERAIELFDALTKARNAAVHLWGEQPVTRGEALEFTEQARILETLVTGAIKRLDEAKAS